jgi:hypothetical protein
LGVSFGDYMDENGSQALKPYTDVNFKIQVAVKHQESSLTGLHPNSR